MIIWKVKALIRSIDYKNIPLLYWKFLFWCFFIFLICIGIFTYSVSDKRYVALDYNASSAIDTRSVIGTSTQDSYWTFKDYQYEIIGLYRLLSLILFCWWLIWIILSISPFRVKFFLIYLLITIIWLSSIIFLWLAWIWP